MSRVAAVALRAGPHSATHDDAMSIKGCSDRAEQLCTRLTPIRSWSLRSERHAAAIASMTIRKLAKQEWIGERMVVADFDGRMGDVELGGPLTKSPDGR